MSQENVEIVREVVDLVNSMGSGEPDPRLTELFAADVKIDMSRRTFNPDTYEGHEDLRRLQRERDAVWEGWSNAPEQLIDAGERVVVIHIISGRGKGSGVEITNRTATVWTVREGQVIHVELYPDPHEALKAVALER